MLESSEYGHWNWIATQQINYEEYILGDIMIEI